MTSPAVTQLPGLHKQTFRNVLTFDVEQSIVTLMETTTPQFTTDNRWTAGASGANHRGPALALYGARWIDRRTFCDIVGDRQGFAYNDIEHAKTLASLMNGLKIVPSELPQNETVIFRNGAATIACRRYCGYIHVDAWLEEEA